jgi:LysR family transcriptional regulator, nitrogen assimilation regulatory protein
MEVRQLQYFVAIVDFGSLSKAAVQLRIAQPALSQQMTTLEGELGRQLLVRNSRGVKPTAAGLRLYRHARLILRQLEQLRLEVGDQTLDLAGSVAIGLPTTTATVLAAPLLVAVRQLYPNIKLQIFESLSGYLTELLMNNRLDCAVLFRDSAVKGLSLEPLVEEDLFLVTCAEAPLAAQPKCSIRDLAAMPLVLPSIAHDLRLLTELAFMRLGIKLNVVADVDSLPTLREIARLGVAVTILPRSAIASSEAAAGLISVLLVDPGITRPVALCYPEGLPKRPAVEAVASTLKKTIVNLISKGKWTGVRPSSKLAGIEKGI